MRGVIELLLSLIFLLGGGGYLAKSVHDEIRDLTFSKIRKGLPSLERIANGLTGSRLADDMITLIPIKPRKR
jgi:hypothetical protein